MDETYKALMPEATNQDIVDALIQAAKEWALEDNDKFWNEDHTVFSMPWSPAMVKRLVEVAETTKF